MADKVTSVEDEPVKKTRHYTPRRKKTDGSEPVEPPSYEQYCQMRMFYTDAEAFIIAIKADVEFKKGMRINPTWRVQASQISTQRKIMKRMQWLHKERIDKLGLDKESRLAGLKRNLLIAEEEGNHTAIVKYYDQIGKLLGDTTKIDITTNKALDKNTVLEVTKEEVDDTIEDFEKSL